MSMLVFLIVFYVPFGGLHVLFFVKARRAFALGGLSSAALAAFLVLMALAPILIRMAERGGHFAAARALALVAYPWIAIVFWYALLFLAFGLWNALARRAWPGAAELSPRATFLAASAVVVGLSVWGVIETSRLRVREVRIRTDRLPPGAPPIRLVQISDLHLSVERGEGVVRRVADKVRALKPDLLVSTGDLVDAPYETIRGLAAPLAALQPPGGKYAVLGNHEYYTGLRAALAFHEAAGFRLLRQEAVTVAPGLRVAGVDDPAGGHTGQESRTDETAVGPAIPERPYTVLLKHQPKVHPAGVGRFDLQLSGHVHGGQIFPFHAVVRLVFPLGPGLHDLAGGARMLVSGGAGTWGPPFRVLAPPDICLVTLEPQVANAARDGMLEPQENREGWETRK